ncbi:MAG: HAMP domain-containing sensor histidine kinase [Caldimonas sp.]
MGGDDFSAQRAALGAHFRSRIPALIEAWRAAIVADPQLTTGDALPREQLVDHLPRWLEIFAGALAAAPGEAAAGKAAADESKNAEAHGLQRWQQGYDLEEVTREWGALNQCLVRELERYAAATPDADRQVLSDARSTLALYLTEATSESASTFFRLERLEAAGSVRDLEEALGEVRELEQRRAELWQQAAHDLRGNLGVVSNVAHGLTFDGLPAGRRQDFLDLLRNNVLALNRLLDDVTDLARLQAGQEQRRLATFDAAQMLHRLCDDVRPMAEARHLFLKLEGPDALPVEGDAVKIRRVAQNLLLNSLKYTLSGGVTVTWGDTPAPDDGRWFLSIEDTGPGFHAGPGAPLVSALAATSGQELPDEDLRPVSQSQGEGLGLAIVKRLCELLGASIELDSEIGHGTTFRVLLPRRYPAPPG